MSGWCFGSSGSCLFFVMPLFFLRGRFFLVGDVFLSLALSQALGNPKLGSVFSRFLSCRCWWSWWVVFSSLVLVFVGLPLCLCCLSWPSGAFFSVLVGGVPFAAFSWWFPLGSRVDWGCVLLSSFCRLLHLASPLALRETWSTDPQPPRPVQPFALARPASPVSCWESSVGRAEVRGCKVTGGFVTLHTV